MLGLSSLPPTAQAGFWGLFLVDFQAGIFWQGEEANSEPCIACTVLSHPPLLECALISS